MRTRTTGTTFKNGLMEHTGALCPSFDQIWDKDGDSHLEVGEQYSELLAQADVGVYVKPAKDDAEAAQKHRQLYRNLLETAAPEASSTQGKSRGKYLGRKGSRIKTSTKGARQAQASSIKTDRSLISASPLTAIQAGAQSQPATPSSNSTEPAAGISTKASESPWSTTCEAGRALARASCRYPILNNTHGVDKDIVAGYDAYVWQRQRQRQGTLDAASAGQEHHSLHSKQTMSKGALPHSHPLPYLFLTEL